jgi:hypothetical protein
MNLQIRPETDPLIDFIPIDRIHHGEPIVSELMVSWIPPADLTIGEGWKIKAQEPDRVTQYTVEETATDLPGRAFRLTRDPEDVAESDDDSPHYAVYIGDAGAVECECRGFASVSKGGRVCRHVAAVRHLLSEGYL